MDMNQLARYLAGCYVKEEGCFRLTTASAQFMIRRMLRRLGTSELLFYPDNTEEVAELIYNMERELYPGEWLEDVEINGFTALHEIPFHVRMDFKGSFSLYFDYTQEKEALYLPQFAACFPVLVTGEDGLLAYETDLLENIKIKEMTLQVDEYNLEKHDSTFFDGVFGVEECEKLLQILSDILPDVKFPREWKVTGDFYYRDVRSTHCGLDIETLYAPLPEELFAVAYNGRKLTAQKYYIRICTHVLDESDLDNYVLEIREKKYISTVSLGFRFHMPERKGYENGYSLEWDFLQENCGEAWLYGILARTEQDTFVINVDDAFLCYFLGIMPGQFFRGLEEGDYVPFHSGFERLEKGKFSIFCSNIESPSNRYYYQIQLLYYEIEYSERRPIFDFDIDRVYNGLIRQEEFGFFRPVFPNITFLTKCKHLYQETRRRFSENNNILENLKNLNLSGLSVQIDPKEGRFRIETAPPIGESYQVEDTELTDWNAGFGTLPISDGNTRMKVEYFRGEGNLSTQEFQMELFLDTSALLTFSIGSLKLTVEEIGGYLNYSPQNTGIGISGVLRFCLKSEFALYLSAVYEKEEGTESVWSFEAGLYHGNIPLDEIIACIAGYDPNVSLQVTKLHIFYATNGSYLVDCGIEAAFPVFGGMRIFVEGKISKTVKQDSPDIYLAGQIEIQYFLFDAKIFLPADGSRKYFFSVKFDDLIAEAVYETNEVYRRERLSAEESGGVLTITLRNFTIGAIIKALMRVLRPNVNFKLPKPWDLLNRIGFPQVNILFHTDTKDISVTLPVDIDLLILQVNEVGFTYVKREDTEDTDAKFNILVKYTSPFPIEISGRSENIQNAENGNLFQWDAFHQPAPGILSEQEKKKLEILYFGLGRRINLGLAEVQDQTLPGLLDICRKNVKEAHTLPAEVYDSSYGWFIGARFRILEFLEVGLLFYDPVLYGIQAKVLNNDIVPLKGLDITIYYRKVTENIGLFFVDVCLPDCIRNMEFGALSVTLPRIQVWLYTNGNFKVNFGFPANGNFSESFALQYGLFYGRGGFYFGYLNGDTSSKVPVTEKGYFDPVVELGIGITIGIGRKLNLGVLSLSASLELSAVFEGVFARYLAYDGETKAVYYKCCGTVIVAGEISGEINFYIIKAGFQLYAKASVSAVLESGKATQVSIEATFAVSAYIKIWIIKISFHFEYTYRDTFFLGEASPVPWENAQISVHSSHDCHYDWTPVLIYAFCEKITLWLFPCFTKEDRVVTWTGTDKGYVRSRRWSGTGQTDESEKLKIAILSTYEKTGFSVLLELLCRWALGAQKRAAQEEITREQLEALLGELTDGCEGFAAENLWRLLSLNVSFELDKAPGSVADERRHSVEMQNDSETEQVPMPLPPVLLLRWETLNPDGVTYDSVEYDLSMQEYAVKLFCEYFLLITKAGLQEGVSCMQEQGLESIKVSELTAELLNRADNLSGMVSRFLLAGNRKEDMSVYEAAWQAFDGLPEAGREKETIVHRLLAAEKYETKMLMWRNGMDLTMPVAEGDLAYPESPLKVSFQEEPKLLPFGRKEHCPIALYGRQEIFMDDKPVYSLWKPAEDISGLKHLQIHTVLETSSCQNTPGTELDYASTFLLSFEICREKESDIVYTITAADPDTRNQLKKLISDGEYRYVGHTLLFRKKIKHTSEEKPSGAWYIEETYQDDIVFLRRNLSDITTPWRMMADDKEQEAECVSITDLGAALTLLERMLKIGGEGHYIKLGKEPLSSELFEDDGRAIIALLIQVEENAGAPYIRLALERVGREEIPVIDNGEIEGKYMQTLEADEYGFSFVLRDMETSWGQLVYCVDGEESVPVSSQERDGLAENESYYIHLFELRPREEEQDAEIEEKNPYTRILPEDYKPQAPEDVQKAVLTFGFRDIVGNRTAEGADYCLEEPFLILYHDRIYKLTQLPFSRISYCFMQEDESDHSLHVGVSIGCTWEEEQAGASVKGVLSQIARIYYQYGCKDVEFSLRLLFGDYETASSLFPKEMKESLCGYLKALYLHIQNPENPKPAELILSAVFSCPVPEQVDEILCLPIRAKAEITRDICYVDKISAPPEAAKVTAFIPVQDDYQSVAVSFEACIKNAKLAVNDGLYAIFFPENTLHVSLPAMQNLFYSIPPFSVKLMGRSDMPLTTVVSRLAGEEEPVQKTSYYNIDLEVWMLRFLTFFEQLFEPDKLSLLFQETVANTLARLLDLKVRIAERLALRTQTLFRENADADTEGENGQNAARAALQDYLRKNLAKGYEAAGCAVFSVRQRIGAQYALEGSLENAPGVNACKFTDNAYAAFVTAPENPESVESISLENAVYTFTHLEDRSGQQWYRFLIPFTQKENYIDVNMTHYEKEALSLPIPLRRYPSMPVLLNQSAGNGGEDYRNPTWCYQIVLQCALSAQDRLYLCSSAGWENRSRKAVYENDLFQMLAQFIFNQDEYERLLFGGADGEKAATDVLEDFYRQAERICNSLLLPETRNDLERNIILAAEYTDGLLSRFRAEDLFLPEGVLAPEIILINKNNESCELKIEESGRYYPGVPEEMEITPGSIFTMKLCFNQIDLRKCQSMGFQVYVKRNEAFFVIQSGEGPDVDPFFIYETSRLGFEEMIFPYLHYPEKISAGAWSVERGTEFLQEITGFSGGLITELFISLGQKTGNGEGDVLFRPLAKRLPHEMTQETAAAFLRYIEKVWEGKGLEGEGKYLVKLSVRQYNRQEQDRTEGALLLEIPDIVFVL